MEMHLTYCRQRLASSFQSYGQSVGLDEAAICCPANPLKDLGHLSLLHPSEYHFVAGSVGCDLTRPLL
jgi:hypothetical protein